VNLKKKPKWNHFKHELLYKLMDTIKVTEVFCAEALKNGERDAFNKIEALSKVDSCIEDLEEIRTEIIKVRS